MKLFLLPPLMLAALGTPARADERLLVQAPALIGQYVVLTPAVRRECDIAGQFGKFTLEALADRGVAAEAIDKLAQIGDRKVLVLTIIDVETPPGAGWLGKMGMTALIELKQGGRALATKELRGRAHAALPGTCNGLESASKSFGNAAAKWVQRVQASRSSGAEPVPEAAAAPAAASASAAAE